MLTLHWTNRTIMRAHRALQLFLYADDRRTGATAYKAARLLRALSEPAEMIRATAKELVERYQKTVEVEGKPQRIPAQQDGHAVPLSVWCTDPEAYQREDDALMAVEEDVNVPVRFTYEELAQLAVPGEFMMALFDVIDAPKDEQQDVRPVVPPVRAPVIPPAAPSADP
jgi:hypothetical protein